MTSNFYNLSCTAIYLALILLVGYTIMCTAGPAAGRHWAEVLGISFAAGAGVVPVVLFLASITGAKPNRWILAGIALIAVIQLAALWRGKRWIQISVPSPWQKPDVWGLLGVVAMVLIIATVINAAVYASWPGINDTDLFAIWLFKAKVVALSPLRPIPAALLNPTLSYSHQDYPLALPFLVSGLYAVIGRVDDTTAKFLCLPIYLALIAIIYGAIRRLHRRPVALCFTAIFAAGPTLCQNAGLLVAETSLLLAMAATVTLLLRWIELRQRGDLLLTAMFASIAAFTKNEGLAMLPVIGVVCLFLAASRRKGKDGVFAVLICILTIGPWLIYRTQLPKTHEDYGGKLTKVSTITQNAGRAGEVLREFLPRVFDGHRAGLIWYVLIIIAILGWRGFKQASCLSLWILLAVQLMLYVGTFVVTPWDIAVLIPTIGPKLLTQLTPLAILLIATHSRELIPPAATPAEASK